MRTAAPGYSASIEYTLLGYDVARFVDELHRLRKTLAGTAQLVTFDELLDVRLSVVDAGRGTVRLDLRAQVPTVEGSGAAPSLPPGPFGPNTQFVVTGLRTDQSYLADIIQELERFLRESEVSVESPWAG
ncbi:MAG: hypothetical protein JXA69_03690 [Phycisphaerae bacterium]|nr:hypothetical protein [Phycisphaerae bacterium]